MNVLELEKYKLAQFRKSEVVSIVTISDDKKLNPADIKAQEMFRRCRKIHKPDFDEKYIDL